MRAKERAGQEPLLSTALFRNRTSNLGLVTQNIQWLLLMGISFVVSAYLQVVRGYNAIETGVIFTAATVGMLVSSLAAERLAKRRAQRTLILAGFVVTIVGIGVFLALVAVSPSVWAFVPGLFLIGLGVGAMLTPSVNVVQSSFRRGAAGRDLGAVAQRVQPRLVPRHRDRRHHPRRRAHLDAGTLVRARDGRSGGDRRRRAGGRGEASLEACPVDCPAPAGRRCPGLRDVGVTGGDHAGASSSPGSTACPVSAVDGRSIFSVRSGSDDLDAPGPE